ncbi:myelin-oligodendrocyte glycoprotein-like isoform X2 [Mastacembelus armatus]|uniref:myelin-oligodendrocyte glycoprotein-like isoform X2 n=1 Tax=Mastacembelus armatus TaxID=205130 RepID=UPI000E45BD24|nr:myelin-oligodendrocyte glycoprotein-like isoform X2 [Mastacembelus armatus]
MSTLLLIVTFINAVTAARIICPNEPIEAEIGEDVRLPCLLDPGLDLSNRTVDWTRVNDSKVVFSYRSRMINDIDQLEQYRNRTRLSREDLSVGNMELQMFSAQLSDSGRYRCLVPQLRLSCTTSLIVVNKGQSNRTKTDDFTTSAAPLEEPPSPGRSHIPAILIPIAAAAVVVCGLVVWTKCEKIKDCMRRCRGGTQQENHHQLDYI